MTVCRNCGRETASVNVTTSGGTTRNLRYHAETADTMCANGRTWAQLRYDGTFAYPHGVKR